MKRRKHEHFHITKLKRTYNRQTNTFNFNITYETTPTKQTQRTKEVAEAFGLGTDQTKKFTILDNTTIKIHPTDIVLITGDSGSGKSILLNAIKQDLSTEAQDIRDLTINPDEPIIETIGNNTTQALEHLSKTGLNDAFIFLRTYRQLSDGQKHRYQIARLAETGKHWWLLDEFCSILDRDTAKIVAFNLQRLARQRKTAVIAATTHNDITQDLAPNVHIHKQFGKEITIQYTPNATTNQCSLTQQMQIQECPYTDYKTLSQFHYRTHHCPPPRKTFALKREHELCGTIVYSYPAPFCFGRNQVWKGTLKQLQHDISTISRVIIHPKYRSTGLGAKLVRETLPKAGTPFVEAVAVMARYNPFFEKAGMQKISESKPNTHLTQAQQQLETLGFDPALLASATHCKEKLQNIPKEAITEILRQLSQKGGISRRSLISLPTAFPSHKEFIAKLATLDADDLAEVLKRLSFLIQSKVYLFWRRDPLLGEN